MSQIRLVSNSLGTLSSTKIYLNREYTIVMYIVLLVVGISEVPTTFC